MVLFVQSVSKIYSPLAVTQCAALIIKRQLSKGSGFTVTSFLDQLNHHHHHHHSSNQPLNHSPHSVLVASVRHSGTVADLKESSLLTKDYSKRPTREIEIQTCGSLYEKWKSKKTGYRRAPKEGLKLKVNYVDTLDTATPADSNSDPPVVLALHGAPGNHGDFAPLINHLAPKGARIIAPNFPEYSLTDTTVFRHTVHEKTEYLKDFLKGLNVKKIDMLVTHSSACYPGLQIWSGGEETPEIKSLVLINPAGHRRIQAMKPKWFIDGSVRLYLNPIGRWIYRRLGNVIFKLKGVPVRVNNIDNVLLSATTMYFSEVEKLPLFLKEVRDRQVPLLYVFSENDKLVDTEVFYEMAEMLGVTKEKMTTFDKEGNLEKKGPEGWNTVLCFRSGGHYAFLKHNKIVNVWIENLLRKVYQHQQQQHKAQTIIACKEKVESQHAEHSNDNLRIKNRNY